MLFGVFGLSLMMCYFSGYGVKLKGVDGSCEWECDSDLCYVL